MTLGHVWLVGAGPGDPGLITANGLAALRRADVVVYDRLASRELLDETPAEALRIDAGKSAGDHTLTQEEINALLVEYGLAGRRVVRLKGGDPYVFGRGGEEALALAEAGVPCTVIPGVTSAIGGLAAGGIPVTHRAVATSFAVVTGHEDPTKPHEGVDWARLAGAADTIVVLMGAARLDGIARALIEGGRASTTPAAVVQEASTPHQRASPEATASLIFDKLPATTRSSSPKISENFLTKTSSKTKPTRDKTSSVINASSNGYKVVVLSFLSFGPTLAT